MTTADSAPSAKPAGEPRTVAQDVLGYLQLEGVTRVFGQPGGSLLPILQELRLKSDEITYVMTRHESGAAYMADGYYRTSGRLGVTLVTSGPGGSNALTGVVNAHASNSATLLITGEVPQSAFGKGYLQEGIDGVINIKAIFRNATQYSAVVSSPDNFHTLFRQALRQALGRPNRTTHISLPVNVQRSAPNDGSMVPRDPAAYRPYAPCSSSETVATAFDWLTRAQWPAFFLGNGAREALQGERLARFRALAEKFAIPVITTPSAKGIFPETHPMALRTFGMAQCEWPRRYMGGYGNYPNDRDRSKFDAIMVVGSSLRQWATSTWSPRLQPDGAFIQIDVDSRNLGRTYAMDLGIQAEAGAVIDHLANLGDHAAAESSVTEARRQAIAALKKTYSPYDAPDKRERDAAPLAPQRVAAIINDEIPPGSHVFVDVGNCVGWAIHYMAIDPPTQMHSAQYMAPMGFAVSAVVGGKMGAPETCNICITGDGAFLMHGNEVSTARQYGVGAIWVVFFDDDLKMVSQGCQTFIPEGENEPMWRDLYGLGGADLATVARGMGAQAYDASDGAALREAVRQAIRDADVAQRPQVIVAHIDRNEAPPYWKGV